MWLCGHFRCRALASHMCSSYAFAHTNDLSSDYGFVQSFELFKLNEEMSETKAKIKGHRKQEQKTNIKYYGLYYHVYLYSSASPSPPARLPIRTLTLNWANKPPSKKTSAAHILVKCNFDWRQIGSSTQTYYTYRHGLADERDDQKTSAAELSRKHIDLYYDVCSRRKRDEFPCGVVHVKAASDLSAYISSPAPHSARRSQSKRI